MSKASENDNTVKPEAQIPAIAAETLIAEPAEPASQPPDGWYFEFNNNAVSFTTDPEEAADIKRHLEPGETCTEYFKAPPAPVRLTVEEVLQSIKASIPKKGSIGSLAEIIAFEVMDAMERIARGAI
ncbi:hypothetical protein [Limnobacter litoralis]|uniref:Uncharacterized protein n=1 Tax=Limnobacter litoralis TaxID=481366 RepID=A0ABQ5YPR2_9BURK|nr:hypothetical protein [Limnobacter litoralis]GLR26543.1 hypothetical protein GCM10007875_16330 [Limnobacter litoralis]